MAACVGEVTMMGVPAGVSWVFKKVVVPSRLAPLTIPELDVDEVRAGDMNRRPGVYISGHRRRCAGAFEPGQGVQAQAER
jgi:hypothetical protein